MRKSFLAILFAGLILAGSASAVVNITATVGNGAPSVGDIQLCTGECGYGKVLDPAMVYVVQVTITDPNGQEDLNLASLRVEWYTTADSNGGTPDWDANTLSSPPTGTDDGCVQAGNTYCLQVEGTYWTTKFAEGLMDVYVYVEDNAGAFDSNEAVAIATVNKAYGTAQDTTSGTYTGTPDSANNPFDSGQTVNAYIITTHTGNCNIDVTAQQTDLTYQTNTIGDGNMSWYLTNEAASSTPFTGGEDAVESAWARGADPTSAVFNLWMWLDIPFNQPKGEYLGTLTYKSSAV